MIEHTESNEHTEFAENIRRYKGLMNLRSRDPDHPITSEVSYLFVVREIKAKDFDHLAEVLRAELPTYDPDLHWYASAAQGTSSRLEGIIELMEAVDVNALLLDKDPREQSDTIIVL